MSAGSDDEAGGRDRLRWVLGWIVLPGSLITLLFLSGVHVGARHPDMWMTRVMLWGFGGQADVASAESADLTPFTLDRRLPKTESTWLGATADCHNVCREVYGERNDGEITSISECQLTEAKHGPGSIYCSGLVKPTDGAAQ